MKVDLWVKKLVPEAILPTYAHPSEDAGMDLYACYDALVPCNVGFRIRTGIALQIPTGYFGLTRPRSGMSVDRGIIQRDSGIIDSGYRGEILVGLHNLSSRPVNIEAGDRVAQLIILPVPSVEIREVNELRSSDRGMGGYGSTGR